MSGVRGPDWEEDSVPLTQERLSGEGRHAPSQPDFVEEPRDFSLVLGGPIFQLLRKSHLAGDDFQLLYRRIAIITGLAWLPLVLLTTLASLP